MTHLTEQWLDRLEFAGLVALGVALGVPVGAWIFLTLMRLGLA